MENMMKRLFDYQRFENNPRIAKMIGEAENRFAQALSDDELAFVNAAGETDTLNAEEMKKKWKK